ncbi:MAG: bifunctional diaminohydroxyphosphoribosylaminopyrimidine deaminase/5-amino-6-(5-phosphoribosylamino)uracil reductase RibD, partial [Flavobacteriales bacterium]
EPCNHIGQTPACAALIERIQPKRVVIGTRDSNPTVTGGGTDRLRASGIRVDIGCLADELAWQNRRFLWNAETKRPWIVLKWAESRDGFLDGRPLQERNPGAGGYPITAETARPLTHTWRALEQGIVVGANTALVDTPRLNVRNIEAPSPRIVLLDPDGLIDAEHMLIQRNCNLIHVVGPTQSPATMNTCDWEVKEGLDALLERLYALFNLSSLLVEGGATVLNDFLRQDAWNEIKCWTSPVATGGGLPAPPIPEQSRPLPHGMESRGQLGVDTWTNRLHPRHAFD